PPLLEAEFWGTGSDPAFLGVKGHAALTNFTFRGETVSSFESDVQYTNQILQFNNARLLRGATDDLQVDGLAINFIENKAYMTNGVGVGNPMVVARAIGPQIVRVLEPYQFARPPHVRAHGVIPLRGSDADLYFDVAG